MIESNRFRNGPCWWNHFQLHGNKERLPKWRSRNALIALMRWNFRCANGFSRICIWTLRCQSFGNIPEKWLAALFVRIARNNLISLHFIYGFSLVCWWWATHFFSSFFLGTYQRLADICYCVHLPHGQRYGLHQRSLIYTASDLWLTRSICIGMMTLQVSIDLAERMLHFGAWCRCHVCIDGVNISLRCFMRIKKTCSFCKRTINLRLKVYLHMWLFTFFRLSGDVKCPYCKKWSEFRGEWARYFGGIWLMLLGSSWLKSLKHDQTVLIYLLPIIYFLGRLVVRLFQIFTTELE